MGAASRIKWTHSTYNPWRGCTKVDPTCANCYMFSEQRRYGRDPSVVTRCAPGTFNAPLSPRWERVRAAMIAEHGVHLVFTCSWSDFFHADADAWRDEAWDVIRRTPGSTYQILTSRPERILEHLPADWGDGWANVWMGATIGTRAQLDRADRLREVPAVLRYLSCEPLLGPLVPPHLEPGAGGFDVIAPLYLGGIGWVIVGGESGGRIGRRLVDEAGVPIPHKLQWVRDLRDACTTQDWRCECGDVNRAHEAFCYRCGAGGPEEQEGGTAFFFKQWGGAKSTSHGRELDGRTWDEIPTVGRLLTA
jgi:protein gp37